MDPIYQNPNGPTSTEITHWKPALMSSSCQKGGKRKQRKQRKSKNIKSKSKNQRRRTYKKH